MPRKKKPKLPPAGAAFAFPIGDGRFSVCRLLVGASSECSKEPNGNTILVACSKWIGDEIPQADNPDLRPILYLNHHSWDNSPNVIWISEEPPQDFVPIGNILPSSEEKAIHCVSYGSWGTLTIQPLLQWKWDNEREAVLAEDIIKKNNDAEQRQLADQEREDYLNRITLKELLEHPFFSKWKGYRPKEVILASRKLMIKTVKELIELGSSASEKDRLAVLQSCIESFNELDSKIHFIQTIEREDICEEFDAIVSACGLGSNINLADEWREW